MGSENGQTPREENLRKRPKPAQRLRTALAKRTKDDLIDVLVELAGEDRAILRRLAARIEAGGAFAAGIAIGRRNWLFLGSDRGGRAAAVHFSLIASCLRNNVEPFKYLRDLLTCLPALLPGASRETLRSLLPDRWQPAK